MTWPTGGISTTDLDSGSDSVGNARVAILAAVQQVNDLALMLGVPLGAASLDSAGKVPSAQIPGATIPSGAGMEWYSDTLPSGGWLWQDGSAISRATYASLFAVLGTQFGVGDGSTTFNLPDRRGRVGVGKDNMGGTDAARMMVSLSGVTTSNSAVVTGLSSTASLAIGMSAIGANIPAGRTIASIDSATQVTLSSGTSVTAGTATIRFGAVDAQTLGSSGGAAVHTLATTQIPAHNHNFDAGGNSHYILKTTGGALGLTSGGVVANTATGVQNTGGGQAHPNVQPSTICNFIIKT